MPPGAFNRRADKWKPLFAIAQLVGGKWSELVKSAYLKEESESKTGATLSTSLQLLSDIRDSLNPGEEKIWTDVLIDRLCKLDDSPWSDHNFREGDGERRKIQSRQNSNHLKPYRVKPKPVRIGGDVQRGYHCSDLDIAFNRYLPTLLAVTPLQLNNDGGPSDSPSVTHKKIVTDRKTPEANKYAGCNGVTDKNSLSKDEEQKSPFKIDEEEDFDDEVFL